MTDNEKQDGGLLSFEELREKLGMNEPPAPKKRRKPKPKPSPAPDDKIEKKTEDITAELEKALEASKKPQFTLDIPMEDDSGYVDITDKYITERKRPIDAPPEVITKRKKVRTFNQIFSDFFKGFIPLKKDSGREKARKIVMDLALIAIIGSALGFGELYRQYRVQLKTEEELKSAVVLTEGMDENEYSAAWAELFKKYPSLSVPQGMNLKYAYLYALNQDLAGWLKIPGTDLDVQLVQSEDDDKYLKKNFYGKQSRYGTPYVDSRNDMKYLQDNTIVYGHHMSDGLMFTNLDKYKTLEGYKESPVIQLDTLYETYYFKVFAAFITNSRENDDNGYVFNYTVTDFSTDKKFTDFIGAVEERSIFDSGITVQPDDKLLTLVTCSYEFDEARMVVMARMVRENEEPTVNTGSAAYNPSPRYPQAWYDAEGLNNPYAEAEQWNP